MQRAIRTANFISIRQIDNNHKMFSFIPRHPHKWLPTSSWLDIILESQSILTDIYQNIPASGFQKITTRTILSKAGIQGSLISIVWMNTMTHSACSYDFHETEGSIPHPSLSRINICPSSSTKSCTFSHLKFIISAIPSGRWVSVETGPLYMANKGGSQMRWGRNPVNHSNTSNGWPNNDQW